MERKMTTIKTMMLTILLLLMLAFAFLPYAVQASGYEQPSTTVNSEVTINHYNHTTKVITEKANGLALGIASGSTICDAGTKKNQISVGVGVHDGSEAVFFRGCKSIGNFTINGGAGSEDGTVGYGGGFSWKW